jgi:DNA-binding transcriptional ArsR family regulator
MTYQAALQALADPTRRKILELLVSGENAVGELAAELPISRPAVSQHLRLLEQAELVVVKQVGTRRVYSIAPAGIKAVAAYVDSLWTSVLEAYGKAASPSPRHAVRTKSRRSKR